MREKMKREAVVSASSGDGRPLLLNGCCCAGGSCYGYELAGFEVWGVDIEPQPNYVNPARFIQANILDVLADRKFMARFSAAHVSPPCQGYSPLNAYNKLEYPMLIEPVRELLDSYPIPYVIENVPGAPLKNPIVLCGYMFDGLMVERHRLFEFGKVAVSQPEHPAHTLRCTRNGYLPTPDAPLMSIHGGKHSRSWQRKACEVMGTPWLAVPVDANVARIKQGIREVCEAIPPVYSKWTGGRLMEAVRAGT
jgi:DNA (cytosine-5)-methyltransferase 1